MKTIATRMTELLATTCAVGLLASCTTSSSTFDTTDSDKDGRISNDEVEDLLINAIFERDDANGDGQVTLAEWQAANPQDDPKLFTARDADKDGVVTLAETSAYAKQTKMFDKFIDQLDVGDDGLVSSSDVEAFLAKHQLAQ